MPQGVNISNGRITLRSVEPSDIEVMYGVENDLNNWSASGTTQPFSNYILEQFVESQRVDIFSSRQLRLMATIEGGEGTESGERAEVVGIVDLFDFDPLNHRAGVGIVILEGHRRRGYATETLAALHTYARNILQLHQLWCGVAADNEPSLTLFKNSGYTPCGIKRDWLWRGSSESGYVDEVTLQRVFL